MARPTSATSSNPLPTCSTGSRLARTCRPATRGTLRYPPRIARRFIGRSGCRDRPWKGASGWLDCLLSPNGGEGETVSFPISDQAEFTFSSVALFLAGIIDLHGLHLPRAAILEPFKGVMVVVLDFDDLADLHFHAWHRFYFGAVREGF